MKSDLFAIIGICLIYVVSLFLMGSGVLLIIHSATIGFNIPIAFYGLIMFVAGAVVWWHMQHD